MKIRHIKVSDAEKYLNLCRQTDAESDFLLYEAGERPTTIDEQEKHIKAIVAQENSTIFVVEDNNKLVGYLMAIGGKARRNKHSLYIVISILKSYTGKGIGTSLFKTMEDWAQECNIYRFELGLMATNFAAFALYKKMGFEIEGVKKDAFYVNGEYINEYMMAKFL